MPRRRPHEPYVQIKVNLPGTLNALLEEELWDPVLKKPRYGERSDLICNLIARHLERKQRGLRPAREIAELIIRNKVTATGQTVAALLVDEISAAIEEARNA